MNWGGTFCRSGAHPPALPDACGARLTANGACIFIFTVLQYFGRIFGGRRNILHGLVIVADAIAAVAVVQYRFDVLVGARIRAELVALFMDKQFALCALEALPA